MFSIENFNHFNIIINLILGLLKFVSTITRFVWKLVYFKKAE